MIIILPTLLTQAVATYIFYDRHWRSISRNHAVTLAGEIAASLSIIKDALPEERHTVANIIRRTMNLEITYKVKTPPQRRPLDLPRSMLASELESAIPYPFMIAEDRKTSDTFIYINFPKETIRIRAPQKRLENPSTYIFIAWMTGSAGFLLIVSLLFMRIQIRSILRLAEAAEQFGRGQDVTYKPHGAREIRKAGTAFLRMKDRIRRQISRRTEMLAYISHDLRTPLTRMKLQLALLPLDKEVKALQTDVQDMQQMVEGYLDFVRGQSSEPTETLELGTLLKAVIESYNLLPEQLSLIAEEPVHAQVRPQALKRAIKNLIDNAIRFAPRVVVTLVQEEAEAVIQVEDDGTGIPENQYREVVKPFFRLDDVRNHNTGGTGLGLAITRDIIHGHGGEMALSRSPLGGLRVTLYLPT